MTRSTAPLALLALALAAGDVAAQQNGSADREALVRNALSAAPPEVAAHATVALPTGETLRAGTNDYVCMPDDPTVPNNVPMCLDAPWREVIDAWMNRRDPRIAAMGVAYMLQGDMPVSNVDPFATAPSADNQWIEAGPPHLMVVLPDAAALDGLPTDPDNGGPWVMWKGTPYAHVMIPTVARRP